MAEQLPRSRLLDSLIAAYEAGRLIGLLGSVVLRCIDAQTDEAAPPEPGLWPRIVRAVGYDAEGNLQIAGMDDNDRSWAESVSGRSQEAWLLKQLYVERRYGRRRQRPRLKKQARA